MEVVQTTTIVRLLKIVQRREFMKHSRKHYLKRISYYLKKKDLWAVGMCIRCLIKSPVI